MSFSTVADQLQLEKIKGFLADDEAKALYEYALEYTRLAPCLEIGSYCGKSSIILGKACEKNNTCLYAVDHHRGSEEHQYGEEYFDEAIFNIQYQHVDSFPLFRQAIDKFQLNETVIPIVAASAVVAKDWQTPLGMAFIDGGHSPEMSRNDCLAWAKHVSRGGILAIHDIFERPEQGGQGPYLALNAVLDSGRFTKIAQINSLGILRRDV